MSALALHAPVLKLATTSVPQPLRQFFREAELAELPSSVWDVHFDTDSSGGCRKTLLSFSANRADINLFILLSPGLGRTQSTRIGDFVAAASGAPSPTTLDGVIGHEPDFPWWDVDPAGPGRRYAYTTQNMDFVEVIIDDLKPTVFIRSIN